MMRMPPIFSISWKNAAAQSWNNEAYGSRRNTVYSWFMRQMCIRDRSWEGYERIVCVGSIYAGRLAKQLLACIRANTKELAGKSVGMLLCGMSDAAPEKIITENLGEACYRQLAFSVNIGGRLDFQKLGFLERKIIRMVNKQEHLYEDKDAVLVDLSLIHI